MNALYHKVGFFTAFIIPVLVVAGAYIGGWGNFITVVFAFSLLPIIDHASGITTNNVPASEIKSVDSDFFYRFITYIWTWFQLGAFFWGAYTVASGRVATMSEWTGFLLSFALMTGGIGITVAHELGHKKSRTERFYSKLLLMTVSYMHFYIEHNRGHHVLVATPLDPATARRDETFYVFWLRSVIGGYRHAWHIENDRVRRKTGTPFHFSNEMIWYQILPFLLCAMLTAIFSFYFNRIAWEVSIFFLIQSFLAFTLLELVNYVEHYGIQRRQIEPGKYERVNPKHLWNSSQLVSNFFLFQLQRHSDHHAFAHKRYQLLNHYHESPQLPFGYPTMILVALVPPVWFRLMNHRLDTWTDMAQAS